MDKKALIFTILLTWMLIGFTNVNSGEEKIKNTFQTLQKAYFLKLDLRAPEKELQTIPTFFEKLSSLAEKQEQILLSNKSLNASEKELAGLIFIYDAMMNANIIIGVMNGKLSLVNFTKLQRFSKKGSNDSQELLARAEYNIEKLKLAKKLRPNDHRIDSWIIGAQGIREEVKTGHLSQETKNAIIKTVGARPSFNLWTAILMLHNEPEDQKQALVTLAKNFVDGLKKGNDPCIQHPSDCASTWKAPYNFQASVTELGDVFLQQAEYLLTKGDLENAMIMAGYAKGTYSQLDNQKHVKETTLWPDYDALTIRNNTLADIQKHVIPKKPLNQMNEYQRVYECASCHGRVTP